jgi:hypothetical protein
MPDAPPLPTLHALGLQAGTDKATNHQFTQIYPYVLESLRSTRFDMIEIGTYKSESLRMWERYFPHARVHGADRGGNSITFSERLLKLDQSLTADIQRVAKSRNWTVVIDDGSHKPLHQLNTFMHFFPALAHGGIYIIEDTETSFWSLGRAKNRLYGWTMEDETEATDVIERFVQAVHMVVNFRYQCTRVPIFSVHVDRMIASVQFLRNAIVVIKSPYTYKYSTWYWGFFKKGWINCSEPRHQRQRRAPFPTVSEILRRRGLYDERAWFAELAAGEPRRHDPNRNQSARAGTRPKREIRT